ncbi:hypothetical protein [Georgenia sp. SYP-B2076]|uniref:hypothetical protein n=1 Tax=Georgenia sp. SYP-B2076 TaxID=2495881 RepID=UPI000F8EE654|nr:hypothetical protein [Georgenia sp. SYP-B2076]
MVIGTQLPRRRSGIAGLTHLPGAAVAAGAGAALGALFAAVALARRSRPLHPRGAVASARMELFGGVPDLGSLGVSGHRDVLARFSRAVGLPAALPDIQGLALRWQGLGGPNDVLLASTGTGPWSRYVLSARRSPLGGAFTSLMPFAGPNGPVLLAAEPTGEPRTLAMRWATPQGPWQPFGTLVWRAEPATDSAVRFDPVDHCPDGLGTYPWTARLRRYPYRWSRRAWPGPSTG